MMKKFFASSVVFFVCLLAAPVCFSEPASDTAPASKPTPVYISTKPSEGFILPLSKNTKSIVCVNRNFNDTQKFGNAFCVFLDNYSSDCRVLLAEFVPKEKVSYYDYVWTFQVKKWKDKNLDDIPESVSALVLLYDKDFNLLLKSNLKASQNKKDPSAPNCLESLLKEYIDSLFNNVVQVEGDVPAVEKPVKEKKAKAKKEKPAKDSKKNEEQAE